MTDPQTMPGEERWIVQGEAVASGRLHKRIKSDPEIKQLRQVARDVVVLVMSAERAEELKSEFGAHLIIERDVDLKLNVDPPRD